MGLECDYSYKDLFLAAHKRQPTSMEASKLAKLNQTERNAYVKRLAKLAQWQTKETLGSDDQTYIAFAPKF